jgi:hypothetical protein
MTTAHSGHTATLLPNGTILVVGGFGGATNLANAEIYDPISNTWNGAGAMATGRVHHTATLLPNDTILVVGGTVSGSISLASAEIYNPR